MFTLYRAELMPPAQEAQQQTGQGPLPMQRPSMAQPQQGGNIPPSQQQPYVGKESNIDQRMYASIQNKISDVQDNRFTGKMQERVGSIATNLRGMIESGQLTEEEAKQVMAESVGSEFKDVTGWMNGKTAPKNYKETSDPTASRKFLEENKQALEEMRDLKRTISEREEKLRTVFDKKNPNFMKSSQDLQQMKQKYDQMFQGVRGKMIGGSGFEADKAMRAQRGEEVL